MAHLIRIREDSILVIHGGKGGIFFKPHMCMASQAILTTTFKRETV